MIVFIKLTPPLGTDIGPFMIYSNWDGFTAVYGINISLTSLLNGVSLTVPDGTTQVKIRCNGKCTNDIIVNVGQPITITSTSTSTSTSTTSSTTSTTAQPGPIGPTTTSSTTSSTTTSTTRRLRFSTSTTSTTTTTMRPNFTTTSTTTISPTTTSTTTEAPPTSTTTTSTSTTSTTTTTTLAGGGTHCVKLGLSIGSPSSACAAATSDVYIVHPGGIPCTNGCDMCSGDRIYTDPGHTNLVSSLYHFIVLCNQDDVQCARVFNLVNGVVGTATGLVC